MMLFRVYDLIYMVQKNWCKITQHGGMTHQIIPFDVIWTHLLLTYKKKSRLSTIIDGKI